MRGFIYLFMAVAGLSAGAIGYFALGFTPIEAWLLTLVAVLGCWLALELGLRRRAEARLEKAIEDLSRLHARDSVASQEIGDRLEAFLKRDLPTRVDVIEADVSVLGTVVRQVAESMATLEERIATQPRAPAPAPREDIMPEPEAAPDELLVPEFEPLPEPVIPAHLVMQALDEDRLIFHMQPIVTLPQRKTHGYDLVPRLILEDGELADPPDFMPRQGAPRLVVRIEKLLIETAITVVRRAHTGGQAATLFVPLGRASLADFIAREQMLATLEANRAVAKFLVFTMLAEDFHALTGPERDTLEAISGKGAAICLDHVRSLRADFAALARIGVSHVKVEADFFIGAPHLLSDFHSADVVPYLARSGVSLIARDVKSEAQILGLLDDGVKFAQGAHIAPPSPIRADLLGEMREPAEAPLKRA